MATNSFRSDDKWQRGVRDKYLRVFYARISPNGYWFLDPPKGRDDSCALAIQKEIGVDTLVKNSTGDTIGIEEKIVRWPEDDEAHGAYALETWSCTLPGRDKQGWMYYSAADTLLYAFQQADESLLVDLIPMQPLRAWFFEKVEDRMRLSNYPMHQQPSQNRTEVRVVPIEDVWSAVDGCSRYHVEKARVSRATSPLALDKRSRV